MASVPTNKRRLASVECVQNIEDYSDRAKKVGALFYLQNIFSKQSVQPGLT